MPEIHTAALQEILDDIARDMARQSDRGSVATYIPELAKADPKRFGIAVAPIDGEVLVAGDADVRFSIQSISKVFTLTLAMNRAGHGLWSRVGREPSGNRFNSIVQLEQERGVPRNPFINAGAIVLADILLEGRTTDAAIGDVLELCRRLAQDESIGIDSTVALSEARTGERNRALAYFMSAEGNLREPVDKTLEVYFHQCAIAMSCRQLARAGSYLSAAGRSRGVTDKMVTLDRARRIIALMMTCGLYDASGEFAFQIGIPAKSGVGGGILGIVPGVASIAAWSPGLDSHGNSQLAQLAVRELARRTGWSVFGPVTAA